MKMRVSEPADVRYVRENYFTLAELCRHAGLPAASYVLEDGTEYYPADYLEQRFTQADFARMGVEDAWTDFQDGIYGICLRDVTPQNIARKSQLIEAIASLLESPDVTDPAWREDLRQAVRELDALEREFCNFDRRLFGRPVSRDTYITSVRETYSDVFERDHQSIRHG